jgi:predicted phage terminase large subunit-like protein
MVAWCEQSDEMVAELEALVANWDNLTPSERDFVTRYAKFAEKGCRTNSYMEHARPNLHPKQKKFLALTDLEVMFGGAAGGSKSDSLLLAALQFVDLPDYSAIIFRRTYTDLALKNAIMDRSHSWLDDTDAKWNDQKKRWTFPSGSSLSFGYMEGPGDCGRYKSAEFQFIGWDEATEMDGDSYLFMFSRLRRNMTSQIPLRVRGATNPGGRFGDFYKARFIPQEYLDCDDLDFKFGKLWTISDVCGDCDGTGKQFGEECIFCFGKGKQDRKFLPARALDNPSLDVVAYRRSLAKVPPVVRAQMERGDWNISEEGGIFRQPWFRQYKQNGDGEYFTLIRFDEHGRSLPNLNISRRDCMIFVTADTATKEKTTADYSVIATWALHKQAGSLLLLDVIRKQVDTPDLLPLLSGACNSAKAKFVLIEEASSGVELLQKLRRNNQCIGGIPVLAYLTKSKDKVTRSVPAQLRMESGMIFFPMDERPWKSECLAEVLSFPKSLHDDFVDNLSMAAWYAENNRTIHVGSVGDAPVELSSGPKLGGVLLE